MKSPASKKQTNKNNKTNKHLCSRNLNTLPFVFRDNTTTQHFSFYFVHTREKRCSSENWDGENEIWYVCVCMCFSARAFVSVCVCARMCASICLRARAPLSVCVCMCVCVHACTRACVRACKRRCMCMLTCIMVSIARTFMIVVRPSALFLSVGT